LCIIQPSKKNKESINAGEVLVQRGELKNRIA